MAVLYRILKHSYFPYFHLGEYEKNMQPVKMRVFSCVIYMCSVRSRFPTSDRI